MIERYSHLHERSNQSPQIVNPQVRLMGKHRTEQSSTDNQVIVSFHLYLYERILLYTFDKKSEVLQE